MFLRRIRENSKIIAIVLALCLAVSAQYLFTGEIFSHHLNSNNWVWTPNNGPALVMLLLAVGFATWGAIGGEKVTVEAANAIRFLGDKPRLRRLWLICSGASYVLSLIVYTLEGENNLVRWLWVAGIGLMIVPLWLQRRGKSPER